MYIEKHFIVCFDSKKCGVDQPRDNDRTSLMQSGTIQNEVNFYRTGFDVVLSSQKVHTIYIKPIFVLRKPSNTVVISKIYSS